MRICMIRSDERGLLRTKRQELRTKSHQLPSNALALTSNQNARQILGDLTGLRERGVGAVPLRVVGGVSCGTSFAVVALAAGGAVQYGLVRASRPIFIYKKARRLGRSGHGL